MSEFFSVTLDDVLLDDSIINSSTGWTGNKILEEIYKHRITKFESLEDVDTTNKADKQVVIYSGNTQKFITTNLADLSEDEGLTLAQISKLGVTGSVSAPYVANINVNTMNFKVPQVNVLKYVSGDSNTIITENTFSNGESDDFVDDIMLCFDGTAHLSTSLIKSFSHSYNTTNFKIYTATLDNEFKTISDISLVVGAASYDLSTTGVANDRLLIPTRDINTSNVNNIDKFTLTATEGETGVKVICSVDGGYTWKTFLTDGSNWTDIDLAVDEVIAKGMNLSLFNSISSTLWNLLITSGKVRFAYLLQNANIVDVLTFQYDSYGYWKQAKDTDFDAIFASNNLLQVKIYFSGDIKINY